MKVSLYLLWTTVFFVVNGLQDIKLTDFDNEVDDVVLEKCPIQRLLQKMSLEQKQYDYQKSAFMIQKREEKHVPIHVSCGLESFIERNPDYHIYVLARQWKSASLLQYKTYERVTFLKNWDLEDFLKLEPELKSYVSQATSEYAKQSAIKDAMTLVVLKHCGGIALNPGMLVMKTLGKRGNNFISSTLNRNKKMEPNDLIISLNPYHELVSYWIKKVKKQRNKKLGAVVRDSFKTKGDLFCLDNECKLSQKPQQILMYNYSTFSRVAQQQAYMLFETVHETDNSWSASLVPPYGHGLYLWPDRVYREIVLRPFRHFHKRKGILRLFNNTCPGVMHNDYLDEEKRFTPGTFLIFNIIHVNFKYPKSGEILELPEFEGPQLEIGVSDIMKKSQKTFDMVDKLMKSTLKAKNKGKLLFCEKDWQDDNLAHNPLEFNECYNLVYGENIDVKIETNANTHYSILGQVFAQKAFLIKYMKRFTQNQIFADAPCFNYIQSENNFVLVTKADRNKQDVKKHNKECFLKIAPPTTTSFTLV